MSTKENRRVRFCVLVQHDTMEGVGDVVVARSIATGHVSMGTTRDKALRCLVGTIKAQLNRAAANGTDLDKWLQSQRGDEAVYVMMYDEAARSNSVEEIEFDDEPLALADVA